MTFARPSLRGPLHIVRMADMVAVANRGKFLFLPGVVMAGFNRLQPVGDLSRVPDNSHVQKMTSPLRKVD